MEMKITFPGGEKVNAEINGMVIPTDQPVETGGEGAAPSPFDYFLASLGTLRLAETVSESNLQKHICGGYCVCTAAPGFKADAKSEGDANLSNSSTNRHADMGYGT